MIPWKIPAYPVGQQFAHPATIDLTCPCGASGRVEANSVMAANALAEPFYRAHAGHTAPADQEDADA